MNTSRRVTHRCVGVSIVLLAGLGGVVGCGDEDGGMVTIVGRIMNIDIGVPAENAVVFLLDHGDRYASVPTSADGSFFLEVPRGSPFALVTNDWAGLDRDAPAKSVAPADDWFTLINFDPAIPEILDDMEIVVHACPAEGGPYAWGGGRPGLGSVAVWRNFVENSTTASQYTDATDLTGKIVIFNHIGTPANEELGIPLPQITGVSIEVVEEGFGEVGYWSAFTTFNLEVPGFEGLSVQDASVGPDIFVDGATANGPGIALAMVFGNTGYSSDNVTLTFTDTRPERAIDFSAVSPVEVPVRDLAATMVMLGSVDNQVRPLIEGLCAAQIVVDMCGQ